jgi:hypothetical protein
MLDASLRIRAKTKFKKNRSFILVFLIGMKPAFLFVFFLCVFLCRNRPLFWRFSYGTQGQKQKHFEKKGTTLYELLSLSAPQVCGRCAGGKEVARYTFAIAFV